MDNSEIPVINQEVVENKEAADTTEQLKKLVEKQSETIDKLLKQQELTNKVNQQMATTLLEKTKIESSKDEGPYEWQERILREKFNLNSGIDLQNMNTTSHSEQVASWMIKYLKDEGNSPEEIQFKMDRLFKGIEGVTPHESIE